MGRFENQLDPGWSNKDPEHVRLSFTNLGATEGGYALQVSIDRGGYNPTVALDLQPYREWMLSGFVLPILWMDVTFDPAMFTGPGVKWAQIELVVNSEHGGWYSVGAPHFDSLNETSPGRWDNLIWPTAVTRTLRWGFPAAMQGIVPSDPGNWFEFVFVLRSDETLLSSGYIVDNVALEGVLIDSWGGPFSDGVIDLADYNNVVNTMGSNSPIGDTNCDGIVDLVDYNNIVNNLGLVWWSSLAVPEPMSAMILAVGLLGLRRGRERH